MTKRVFFKLQITQIYANDDEEYSIQNESYQIIGACFEVYNEKGNGFLEDVYQECIAFELADNAIPFKEKKKLKLYYKGKELKQYYIPDFFCFNQIILEIKAVSNLAEKHRAQVINYLKSTGMKLGLLVNFSHHLKLEHERFINQN